MARATGIFGKALTTGDTAARRHLAGRLALAGALLGAGFALSACNLGGGGGGGAAAPQGETSTRLVDRDVEAPEVFQTADEALWDGRPSLGGVWVASPDAKDPERVIIRNSANGKFVIGALFRREVLNPGPKLQISSDAAAALGILAGAPTQVNVTALRREQADVAPDATKPILDSSEAVETATLDDGQTSDRLGPDGLGPDGLGPDESGDVAAVAGAALDAVSSEPLPAEGGQVVGGVRPSNPAFPPAGAQPQPAAEQAPAAVATAAPATGGATIQIGIFSVEANAKRAASSLEGAGLPARITSETSKGKALWSVTTSGDAAALAKAKSLGFPDAYFLK